MSRSAAAEDVFQAIACPTRRALLDVLAGGESNVSDLVASLDVTQSAVSQQLAVLKSAGLVTERAEGRFRLYRLRAEPLGEVDTWLSRRSRDIHQLQNLLRKGPRWRWIENADSCRRRVGLPSAPPPLSPAESRAATERTAHPRTRSDATRCQPARAAHSPRARQ